MSDFNVPGPRPKTTRWNFGNRPYILRGSVHVPRGSSFCPQEWQTVGKTTSGATPPCLSATLVVATSDRRGRTTTSRVCGSSHVQDIRRTFGERTGFSEQTPTDLRVRGLRRCQHQPGVSKPKRPLPLGTGVVSAVTARDTRLAIMTSQAYGARSWPWEFLYDRARAAAPAAMSSVTSQPCYMNVVSCHIESRKHSAKLALRNNAPCQS